MDKILIALINSDQPITVKRNVVHQIANYGQQNKDRELFKKILQCCLGVLIPDINKEGNEFNQDRDMVDLVKRVIEVWIKSNKEFSRHFIVSEFLHKSLHLYEKEASRLMLLKNLEFLLDIYYNDSVYDASENKPFEMILKVFLYTSLLKTENIIILSLLCKFCAKYEFLVAQNFTMENKNDILGVFVNVLSATPITYFLKQSTESTELEYQYIDNLLSKLITSDKETMDIVGNHIFKSLSAEGGTQSSPCIALLLVHLKLEYLSNSIDQFVGANMPDETLTKILSSMMDWIFVPNQKILADQWISHYMKCLIKYSKYQVLFVVIEAKIKQIFNFIFFSKLRKSSMSLSIFMLICYLHSPKAFHRVCGTIPTLIMHLKKEPSSEENQSYIKMLVELTFTLIYHFSGYPDIYAPLLDVLKEYPKPAEQTMKTWLKASFSIPSAGQDLLATPREKKSSTGKVGLVNLGNTCYVNSIIQALFNLKKIKKLLLQEDNAEPVKILTLTASLKELFVLLHMSKRPAVAPKVFLDLSRPQWFQKGFQQDCSEYLKFLLDKLQTESGDSRECGINQLLTGKMITSVVCSNCGTVSEREELFNDIPLSFHEVLESGEQTLKGGDPSDTLKRKMQCNLAGSNKETVDQPQTSTQNDESSTRQPADGAESSQCVPNQSINDLLDSYLSPEYLKDSNQYFCEECSTLQNATKTIEITEFPAYLILTIKRFTYNVATQKRSKLLHVVRHPQYFSICGGCSECRRNRMEKHPTTVPVNDAINSDENTPVSCKNVQHFRLSSFVVHSGYSSESGHYYSYTCEYDGGEDGNRNSTKCFLMNDSRVTASSLDAISNLSSTFPRDTPYIYIYEKHVPGDDPDGSCDLQIAKRLLDYVQNDDAIYEMELQRDAVIRQKSFLCSRDKRNDDNDDDGGGSFSSGNGNCGPSVMGFEPNRFIF